MHHVTNGLDHQSILLEMVDIILDIKIDMNLVTTEHGDINAKEKINFDLHESDYGQKQYSMPLLTGPAKHFFWK